MKRKTVPYVIGLSILVMAGVGVLLGQEGSTSTKPLPPPPHPALAAPPAAGNVIYWRDSGDDDEEDTIQWIEGTPHAAIPVPGPRPETHRRFMLHGQAGGPWLGVVLTDISAEKAKELKVVGDYGVLVKEVREDTPAAKAGLMKDDVILEFAGEKVRSAAHLRRLVRETPAERNVTIVVSRAGQTKSLTAKLESRPRGAMAFAGVPAPRPVPHVEAPKFFDIKIFRGARLGISGDDLTQQLAEFFGVKQGKGVLVREVTVGSAAEKAGLKAGDVIVAVDGKEVASVGKLRRALAGDKDDTEKRKVTLTIVRDKREQTFAVELEPAQHLGPRSVARLDAFGIDPEEVQEMADEAVAEARELEIQAGELADQAEEWEEQQQEFQKEQEKLQKELRHLQEELPHEIDTALQS